MHETIPRHRQPNTGATLRRFAFRLGVILVFAALWPGGSIPSLTATAVLCLALAAGCLFSARVFQESFQGTGLNHWHEAIALLGIAMIIRLSF